MSKNKWLFGRPGAPDNPTQEVEIAALEAILPCLKRNLDFIYEEPELHPDQRKDLDELRSRAIRAVRNRLRQLEKDDGEMPPHTDVVEERPTMPTADYCMRPLKTVRWIGETEVEPLLWRLLDCLLKQTKWPVPFGVVEGEVWGKETGRKTIPNTISRLNSALEEVAFPWTFSTDDGHILKG